MSTPITYTPTTITEDYAYTLKKYAISTGRPTTAGYTNYRSNPNSKTWYSAYRYSQYHPNGTGYYVISNNRVQGGTATAGNEIPTFHVTGSTDAAILHLINRLPNRGSNFYTNVAIAKSAIISDPESLHFDADLTKYNYYAPQYSLLNFDAGNLNCNFKSGDKDLRNLTNIAVAKLADAGDGLLNVGNDNSSFYLNAAAGTQSVINVSPGGGSLDITSTVDYLVAMRIRIPITPSGTMEILKDTNSNFALSYNGSNLILQADNTSVTININISTTNFATIIFGKDTTNSTLFLHITDSTNTQDNTNTYSTPTNIRFSQLQLASLLNIDDFYIGALQVWSGTGINYTGVMSGVGQSDFFNQIHTMYAGRWS